MDLKKAVLPFIAALGLSAGNAEKVNVTPGMTEVHAKEVPVVLELEVDSCKVSIEPTNSLEKNVFDLMKSKGLELSFFPEIEFSDGKEKITLKVKYNLNGKTGEAFIPGGSYNLVDCNGKTTMLNVVVPDAVQVVYNFFETKDSRKVTSYVLAGGLENNLVRVFPFGFDAYKRKLKLPGVAYDLKSTGGVAPVKYTCGKTKGKGRKDVTEGFYYSIKFNPGTGSEYERTFFQK